MSKLQLLYEKLMRIAYIFGGIFFLLSLINFSAAMMTGAIIGGTVSSDYPFFKATLWPLVIISFIFIVTGYIFFKMAHKEADLLSVSDYKKSLEKDSVSDEIISREDLYEKLKRGNRKVKVQKVSFFKRLGDSISGFFSNIKTKLDESKKTRKAKSSEKQEKAKVAILVEKEKIETEKLIRANQKLNKTALILLLSKTTNLSQNESRLFINTFLEILKDTVISGEEVKITKFGRFAKVHIDKHTEIDPITQKNIEVDDHNTVEFFAFKQLLQVLNDIEVVTLEEDSVVEQITEIHDVAKTKEEPAVEEEPEVEVKPEVKLVVEEEPEVEVKPEVELVVEEEPEVEVKPEVEPVVEEEPKVEAIPEEESVVKEEPEVEVKVEMEPVVEEEPKVEAKPEQEPAVEEKSKVVVPVSAVPKEQEVSIATDTPKKPEKIKPVVKTKKQIIEMMDETTDLSKNKANKFLKFFAEVVKEQLAAREDVELEGIGFFTTIEMPAKEAVNPQSGEKIIVAAHHQVRLRFDDELKDKMN